MSDEKEKLIEQISLLKKEMSNALSVDRSDLNNEIQKLQFELCNGVGTEKEKRR